MGISLTIDQDLKGFDRFLNNNRKQLPFATSVALNNTGFDMRNAFNKGTLSAFNKPTRFTQKAFLTTKSKKTNLIVHVFAKDKEGGDAARYLRFGVKGGARPAKGYERFFSGLPNDGTVNAYFIPSQIKVDGFGNVTRANLKKVSAAVQNNKAFIGTPRNSSRPPGIYERDGNKLITRFVSVSTRPTYTGRFNLQVIGDKVINRRLNQHFNKAMSKAIATAR
tara:strand:+ start:1246 stop:1911 length:666 start_codon:yes stop_codon:yes gene_type:complete